MKVVGIIAEYNPFHKGHKYQIDRLRKETGADYIVIAMSGNFLQRGVPALCGKYTRTKMALSCGADLVLELPVIWATASAEYFAKGGVKLLQNTGVVTHLGFGAESDDLKGLLEISSILKEEPVHYKEILSLNLKQGKTFPAARKEALNNTPLLDSPNNILALEYLKALPEHITPVLIPRKGAGYHDTEIDSLLPSATAIRTALLSKSSTADSDAPLDNAIPKEALDIFKDVVQKNAYLDTEDFSEILGYRLLSLEKHGYTGFADCSQELSNKIANNLKDYGGWDAFCQTLKSKDLTYTRISRSLLHILLNIRQEDYIKTKELDYCPYLRVLGFRKASSDLLSAIKKEASVPLITKAADAASLLSEDAYSVFKKDLYASSIYNQLLTVKKGQPSSNDFTSQIVIL